jgi:hypothetical protein
MPSEAVDVDVGQLVGRRLKDCPVSMAYKEYILISLFPLTARCKRLEFDGR